MKFAWVGTSPPDLFELIRYFSPFSSRSGVGANVVSTVGSNLAVVKGPGSTVSATDNYMRTSNSIGYFLPPNLGGFYGQLQYALPENVDQSNLPGTPSTKGSFFGGRFGYSSGRLDIALAYGQSSAANARTLNAAGVPTGGGMNEEIKTLSIGASYDFGPVKLFGELSQMRDESTTTIPVRILPVTLQEDDKYNGGLIGMSIPVGAGLIRTAYSWVKFDNDLGVAATPFMPNRDASVKKLAIGYEYNLSKRTALYATAAYISVSDGQNNPLIMGATTGASNPYLSTGNGTFGWAPRRSTGYDLGIRHAF